MHELYEQPETTTFNTSQKAVSAYNTSFQRNLSPYMILLELYKAMLKNVRSAKNAYGNKELGKMFAYNQKNFAIISALQSHLDKSEGTKISIDLDKFYTILFHSLVRVLSKPNPLEEFDQIEKSIQDVYSFWIKVGDVASPPASEYISGDTPKTLNGES
jgi:flagellin-specific chaperone FliS